MKAFTHSKALLSTLGFFVYFAGTFSAGAAALNVSQKPLILSETVSPNLILTLDDSGSMRWAFVPDNINGEFDSRRGKSADFNPMYYNPNVTYRIPTRYDTNGNVSSTPYSTSFTQAYNHGFVQSRGNFNLSNSYRVTWSYDPRSTLATNTAYGYSSTSNRFARNPPTDFSATVVRSTNGTSIAPATPAGIVFTINRTGSSTCTATATLAGVFTNLAANCTRTASNTYQGSLTEVAIPAYYYRLDRTIAGCANAAGSNESCQKLVFVSSTSGKLRADDVSSGIDERQNFAIWYSFYRNRALATLSAAQIAFADLPPEVRLTWQSLGTCTSFTGNDTGNCYDNRLREYNNAHKGQLFGWLQDPPFSQSTYLRQAMRRAGEFLKTGVAWQKYPNDSSQTNNAGNTYACRPSYHIMMTDGIWNDGFSSPSDTFRSDNASFTLPNGTTYNGTRAPYADSTQQTVADLAMHYWATDLNTSLGNELRPYLPFRNDNDLTAQFWDPRNNPATWQHMVNFTMGLGLTSSLNQPNIPWDAAQGTFGGTGYDNLRNGTVNWPAAGTDSVNNVYDLWHAAINSRGEFFSVDSPDAMVQAFRDILNRIADRTSTAARPAVSASFVSDSDGNDIQSNVYATQFNSTDWSGQMFKSLLGANGQVTELWNIQSANQGINPTTRRVLMADTGNKTTGFKDFNWINLGSMQDLLNVNPESLVGARDSRGQARVAYIRGERSGEGDNSPAFRKRNSRTVMGDIVNSSPVVVGTPGYLAYLADAIENPSGTRTSYKGYGDFREANKKGSRKEMVYVGGNDGMLHGFNASTGAEEFAFIPTEVIKNLYRLTGQNYSGAEHRYFVDGTPIVRDVYMGDDTGWRTVLVGTLRAGGRALFALDITDPSQIKLLWEFSSTKDNDLGYTFPQPEIVRLHTGGWAVLQANGYDSANDKAALMIIDLKTGDLIKKITVPDIVENNTVLANGLSSVRGADNNSDGVVDYAYAGDLQGNIWRFDLVKASPVADTPATGDPFARTNTEVASTTKDDFKLAYGNRPIFVAKDKAGRRQPITIQPSIVRHPSSYGYLVLVGTGKYFEGSDANVDTSRAMTVYGIWDRKTKRQLTTGSTLVAGSRFTSGTSTGRLMEQSFTNQEDNVTIGDENQSANRDIKLLSQNNPQWYRTPPANATLNIPTDDTAVNHWGWALDMAITSTSGTTRRDGEMIVNNMTASGSILFLSSLTPNQDPCQAGADTWFYGIDAYTGGRTRFNVLDLNADRLVNPTDAYRGDVVSGVRFPSLGGFTLAPGNKIFGSDGASNPFTVGDDPNSSGRQSWHIVPEDFQ